jgi:hypothetical protein
MLAVSGETYFNSGTGLFFSSLILRQLCTKYITVEE